MPQKEPSTPGRLEFGVLQRADKVCRCYRLPADEGWPNTGGYGFLPGQTARPSTLLVYAHGYGRFGRMAKGLKAYKTMFPKACSQSRLQAFRFAMGVISTDRSHSRGLQE